MAPERIQAAAVAVRTRIQAGMRPWSRGWLQVIVLIAAFSALAGGSPIQPDIQKLLSNPRPQQERFTPARAGWDGPESSSGTTDSARAALERFGPAATAREVRAGLISAAMPDPKIWGCLAMLILLLRIWLPEKTRLVRPPSGVDQESNESIRRAA